jgi:3-deoxy-D-manno-octulosonate 8-phosphate phosphatase KdsC-like HAD superfamily phosphatase
VILGSRNKLQAIRDLAEQLEISLEEIAYIGDDVNDYFALKRWVFPLVRKMQMILLRKLCIMYAKIMRVTEQLEKFAI